MINCSYRFYPFSSIDINECFSNPCANGGTCINGQAIFSCECTENWGGDLCNRGKRLKVNFKVRKVRGRGQCCDNLFSNIGTCMQAFSLCKCTLDCYAVEVRGHRSKYERSGSVMQ